MIIARLNKRPRDSTARAAAREDMSWEDLAELASEGGSNNLSGVPVNYRSSLGLASFWRGVNLISRDVARIPCILYEREADEGRRRATELPQYRLVRRKPTEHVNAFVFFQTLQAHVLLFGNAYAWIMRDQQGVPVELIPLNPTRTTPVFANGVLKYALEFTTGDEQMPQMRKLDAADVLHVKGLGFDGLRGYDVISFHKNTIGGAMGSRNYATVFYRNNARPNVVLEVDGQVKDETLERLKRSWESMYRGVENAHKTAILEDGLKAKVLADNAQESPLREIREFDVREIANLLGVPPHKLGDPSRTSYRSLEQENQSYEQEALDGWWYGWEMELYDKLLTDRQKEADSHFFEFKREALVRVDLKSRVDALGVELNNGALTLDEYMRIQNRPLVGGRLGGARRFPLNFTLLGEDGAPIDVLPSQAQPPEPDASANDSADRTDAPPRISLNGAQVTAAKDMLLEMASPNSVITAVVAKEVLIAIGFEPAAAERIVSSIQAIKDTIPPAEIVAQQTDATGKPITPPAEPPPAEPPPAEPDDDDDARTIDAADAERTLITDALGGVLTEALRRWRRRLEHEARIAIRGKRGAPFFRTWIAGMRDRFDAALRVEIGAIATAAKAAGRPGDVDAALAAFWRAEEQRFLALCDDEPAPVVLKRRIKALIPVRTDDAK